MIPSEWIAVLVEQIARADEQIQQAQDEATRRKYQGKADAARNLLLWELELGTEPSDEMLTVLGIDIERPVEELADYLAWKYPDFYEGRDDPVDWLRALRSE